MKTELKNLIVAATAGLVIVAAASMAITPAMAEGYSVEKVGRVTGVEWWDQLNVRMWPASYSQQVGALPDGHTVWIERCIQVPNSSDWCKVERDYVSGWVNSRYLAVIEGH